MVRCVSCGAPSPGSCCAYCGTLYTAETPASYLQAMQAAQIALNVRPGYSQGFLLGTAGTYLPNLGFGAALAGVLR
jgi:hypothetical protein